MNHLFQTIAAQIVYVASNFVLTSGLARNLSLSDFGRFSALFITMNLAVAVGRSIVGDVFVVTRKEDSELGGPAATTGAGLLLGLLSACVVGGAAAIVEVSADPWLLIATAVTPIVLLQDTCRTVLIHSNHAGRTLGLDALWLTAMIGSVPILSWVLPLPRADILVLAWALGAATSCVWGLVSLGSLPSLRHGLSWLRSHSRLVAGFSFSALGGQLLPWMAILLAGAVGGAAMIGTLRGGLTVMAPFEVLVGGTALASVRLLGEAARTQLRSAIKRAATIGIVLVALGVGWTSVLAYSDFLGTKVLGDTWKSVREVLWLVLAWRAFLALAMPYNSLLRALGRIRPLSAGSYVGGSLMVAAALVGASDGDPQTVLVGFVAASGAAWLTLFTLSHRAGQQSMEIGELDETRRGQPC